MSKLRQRVKPVQPAAPAEPKVITTLKRDRTIRSTVRKLRDAYNRAARKQRKRYKGSRMKIESFQVWMKTSDDRRPVEQILIDTDALDVPTYGVILTARSRNNMFVDFATKSLKLPKEINKVIEELDNQGDVLEELYTHPASFFASRTPAFTKLHMSDAIYNYEKELAEIAQSSLSERAAGITNLMTMLFPLNRAFIAAKVWDVVPQKLFDRYIKVLDSFAQISPEPALKQVFEGEISLFKKAIAEHGAKKTKDKLVKDWMTTASSVSPRSKFVRLQQKAQQLALQPRKAA